MEIWWIITQGLMVWQGMTKLVMGKQGIGCVRDRDSKDLLKDTNHGLSKRLCGLGMWRNPTQSMRNLLPMHSFPPLSVTYTIYKYSYFRFNQSGLLITRRTLLSQSMNDSSPPPISTPCSVCRLTLLFS